jgi:hypothetical protein
VLLELILAMALREEPASAVQVKAVDPVLRGRASELCVATELGRRRCIHANITALSLSLSLSLSQAILPVLLGPARTAAEGGGFGPFPFHKLAGLSDEPSRYSKP